MDKLQKILLILLVSTSAVSWAISLAFQVDMMSAMMPPFSPLTLALFVAVWTAGMAAMMFPAISPVILLYNRIIRNTAGLGVVEEDKNGRSGLKMVIFIASYLAVWSLAGLTILLLWTISVNTLLSPLNESSMTAVYGVILVIAGLYQFSPVKSKCLGYCESPMGFFMKRWRKGTLGSLTMGTYHGLYCLGCCWPYFLIMVALGWMDIVWMALFAGVIFAEKIWARGIWVARITGAALATAGILSMSGLLVLPTMGDSMSMSHHTMPEMPVETPSDMTDNGMRQDSSEASKDSMPEGSPGMKM